MKITNISPLTKECSTGNIFAQLNNRF